MTQDRTSPAKKKIGIIKRRDVDWDGCLKLCFIYFYPETGQLLLISFYCMVFLDEIEQKNCRRIFLAVKSILSYSIEGRYGLCREAGYE